MPGAQEGAAMFSEKLVIMGRDGILNHFRENHVTAPDEWLPIADALEAAGQGADVVSMPSWELFDAQDATYRAEVLPNDALKVSIEAGVTLGWQRYTGSDGLNIGLDSFGASAPAEALYDHFGFSVEAILNKIQAKLKA